MKKIGLLLLLVLCTTIVTAQTNSKRITLTGTVIDKDDKSPIIQATVQLLNETSKKMVVGKVTDNNGKFSISANPGKYELKISFVGYKTQSKNIVLSGNKSSINLGNIILASDAIMLKEAVVVAEAPQVTVKEDTLVYNSSAYRTPQGAMLEELVKKLPGAEVDDDGNIKINGKEVKKIMVDGKEFFGGDVATGLKNLPVNMVDNVKAYDKKSDLARITGIDDGEEETVLDLTVKKGMNKGWFGNVDLAGGSESRYANKAMVNYFKGHTQFSVIGDANNVNDQGFSGGGPRWRRSNGLNAKKTLGANFASENNKLETGGSVRYNYSDADIANKNYSERFLQNGNSYSNSNSFNRNKNQDLNFDFRLEWKPDSMTNIIFRPSFSYSDRKSSSTSESGTFNQDPYGSEFNGLDPNEYLNFGSTTQNDPFEDIRVNATNSKSMTKSNSTSGNATLQINRKLNNKGRNITLRGKFGYGDNDNNQYLDSETKYFLFTNDSTLVRKQYVTTPSNNYNYIAQVTYSEPIFKNTFLQFRYKFQYKYNTSNRKTFGLDDWNMGESLPEDYYKNEIDSLSKDATYKYFNHEGSLSLRFIREKYQLSFGVSVQPQNTKLSYKLGEQHVDTTRTVLNFAPQLDYRYRFSKVSQLRVTYNGNNGQPGIEQMLPIINNSNPLNITIGNPGLKPSFTHNLRAFYNTYDVKKQRGVMAHAMFSATQNSVTTSTEYNQTTGGRTTSYDNINGNWNAFGMFGMNSALKNKKYTINSFSRIQYNNLVALLYNDKTKVNDRNKSTNLVLGENLNGTYRNDWFEFTINGAINYNWEKNKLRPENNQEPYTFSYGASTNVTLPWSMNLSTNLTNQSRRGYQDASMNRNELLWNAQIAQTLLKGAATISFEMYDILKQQSNISRSLTADLRSVSEYNGINSYCMLHFAYRFNLFGGKEARKNMEKNFGPGHGPGDRPRRQGGFGGGGGHRPF